MSKQLKYYSMDDWGGNGSTSRWLDLAGYAKGGPEDCDVLVFNGGADIGTDIYGEKPISAVIPQTPSKRDMAEMKVFYDYPDKFKLGICRGAQFLNCLNGGTLWQDVDGHHSDHMMCDLRTGKLYRATSTHHQMMRPHQTGHLIGVSSEATRKRADGIVEHFEIDVPWVKAQDVEIVWYPASRSLCIQGHPEYVPGSDYAEYCLNLMTKCYREARVAA